MRRIYSTVIIISMGITITIMNIIAILTRVSTLETTIIILSIDLIMVVLILIT